MSSTKICLLHPVLNKSGSYLVVTEARAGIVRRTKPGNQRQDKALTSLPGLRYPLPDRVRNTVGTGDPWILYSGSWHGEYQQHFRCWQRVTPCS
jgi:hypothetical protein